MYFTNLPINFYQVGCCHEHNHIYRQNCLSEGSPFFLLWASSVEFTVCCMWRWKTSQLWISPKLLLWVCWTLSLTQKYVLLCPIQASICNYKSACPQLTDLLCMQLGECKSINCNTKSNNSSNWTSAQVPNCNCNLCDCDIIYIFCVLFMAGIALRQNLWTF